MKKERRNHAADRCCWTSWQAVHDRLLSSDASNRAARPCYRSSVHDIRIQCSLVVEVARYPEFLCWHGIGRLGSTQQLLVPFVIQRLRNNRNIKAGERKFTSHPNPKLITCRRSGTGTLALQRERQFSKSF